jgi:hypothetical protein
MVCGIPDAHQRRMVPVFGATVACSIAVGRMNATCPMARRAVSLLLVAQ